MLNNITLAIIKIILVNSLFLRSAKVILVLFN
jgi:hypothetical protein